MQAKPLGHNDLKAAGLDGTWLPRGHFGETDMTCSKGHKIIHHENVRAPHIIILQKNSGYKILEHPTAPASHRIVQTSSKKVAARHDCISYDYDDIAAYEVDEQDGTVMVKCPVDGEILMTYTPNPQFKNFEGELHTTIDGQKI